MWAETGQPPELFWTQTGRSFANTLAGVYRRATVDAWQLAAMSAAAAAGKLQPLAHYLRTPGEVAPEVGGQRVLALARAMKARGVNIQIERVERAA